MAMQVTMQLQAHLYNKSVKKHFNDSKWAQSWGGQMEMF